jgi:dTMP kinase
VSAVSRYVVLEGVDGSGKSTVGQALVNALEERGISAILVREPGGTDLGEAIRRLLLDSESLSEWAEVYLFAAQRAELVREVIAPALAADTWVVSDRSYYSSIAYQGRARGLGEQTVRMINESGLDGVFPDHVFVLDVQPDVALGRQDRPDRIGREGVEFQMAVRDSYVGLSEEEEKVVLLDGTADVDVLVAEILSQVP